MYSVVWPDVGGVDISSLQGAKEDDCILAIMALLYHFGRPWRVASHLSMCRMKQGKVVKNALWNFELHSILNYTEFCLADLRSKSFMMEKKKELLEKMRTFPRPILENTGDAGAFKHCLTFAKADVPALKVPTA